MCVCVRARAGVRASAHTRTHTPVRARVRACVLGGCPGLLELRVTMRGWNLHYLGVLGCEARLGLWCGLGRGGGASLGLCVGTGLGLVDRRASHEAMELTFHCLSIPFCPMGHEETLIPS